VSLRGNVTTPGGDAPSPANFMLQTQLRLYANKDRWFQDRQTDASEERKRHLAPAPPLLRRGDYSHAEDTTLED